MNQIISNAASDASVDARWNKVVENANLTLNLNDEFGGVGDRSPLRHSGRGTLPALRSRVGF
jgi:hypothetical protein